MTNDLRELYRLMLKAKPVVNIRMEQAEYYIHLMYPVKLGRNDNALFVAHIYEGSLRRA